EEFGLGRMRALLTGLGEPQRAYPAIHIVGTNGKSTATRRAAAFLLRQGLSVGAYTSPHVSGWSERIQIDGEDADFEAAVERVRIAHEKLAVIAPKATVIFGEPEWEAIARNRGAARIIHADDVGRAAAEAFLGRELGGDLEVVVPGRLEFSGDDVFAGAHNPA